MIENKNKWGIIVILIFLLICSSLGIAAFVMSFTKKCGEQFDSTNTNCNIKYPMQSKNLENFKPDSGQSAKIYGGWIDQTDNMYYSISCLAQNKNINTLCPFEVIDGKFSTNTPIKLDKIPSHIDNVWVTIGGANVQQHPTVENIIKYIEDNPIISGIMFDMEGWLKDYPNNQLVDLVKKLKNIKNRKLKYIYVPMGTGTLPPTDFLNTFDYVAPMLYSGANGYTNDWGFSKTGIYKKYNCVGNKQFSGNIDTQADKWARVISGKKQDEKMTADDYSKVILTVQSLAATNCPNTQNFLTGIKKLVNDKGYAGVLIWPTEKNNPITTQSIYDCKNLSTIMGTKESDCSSCGCINRGTDCRRLGLQQCTDRGNCCILGKWSESGACICNDPTSNPPFTCNHTQSN